MIIIVISVSLSVLFTAYSVSISNEIDETVTNDLKRQARIEAFQVTQLLEKEVQVVNNNVMTSASRVAIINGEFERGADIINARQQSTPEVTDRYFWLDKDGKVIWSSAFANSPEEYEQFKGFDASDRPYFVNPSDTKQPYLSPVIMSADNNERMFISYPILDNGNFEGVVVASLRADNFGQLVQSKLSKEIESSIGIIDPNGVIVYTSNATLIGENLFGDKIQSLLAPAFSSEGQLTEFNDFLKASLQGGSDSKDFTAMTGPTSTVIYMPIITKTGGDAHHFLTLYLSAPHNIASIVGPLIEQQRNFSIAVVATIAALTVVVLYIVLTWNKRLERTVNERTAGLNQANEQLKIHDKLQTEFVNTAAHELRTPVQPLLNIAEQLEEELGKRHDEIKVSRPEIEMLIRNTKRLSHLSSDLLEVARIESNSVSLRKQKVDLKERLNTAVEDSKDLIEDGQAVDILFEDSAIGKEIFVEADKLRLSEILSNLIQNAIKFTKEGTITVRLEENDGYAEVSVSDTGAGIDPNVRHRLFEKFTTTADKGTGLGLYITKSMVEAHGGKIWAENNLNGKGATFRFTLPLATSEKPEARIN